MTPRYGSSGYGNAEDNRRDADIRDLIRANCPPEDVAEFVAQTLRSGGRVILPCTCESMITTRLDKQGNAIISHYTTGGKHEASTTVPASLHGTNEGSALLHSWLRKHHARTKALEAWRAKTQASEADQIGPKGG